MRIIRSIPEPIIWLVGIVAFVSLMVMVAVQGAEHDAKVTNEVLGELGLADGTEYSAKIIGIRGTQNGISGDFFLGSGEISGLDTAIVIVFTVSVGDADYIMNVALNDVTFIQTDDIEGSTVAFDLKDLPYAERDDSIGDVLKRNFTGLVIRLSPEELERITSEMP